ncbi:ABC transporter ATP-binding protein [Francisella adeliensis]|uniref:ABC transporter ATP-binding protein n=1 Tax=Francisella adeliensis TaxID=2007306 RepID=A0A2Z4XY63_9GAMM|nr:ABC transporter ATP-binding protein [Francisella adeliensis]AXA33694.1 ABC transporter ATP-binding protein [Francisella adeliensis]MBK2085587.1 ABC transporter ATP-binding protein [Francisella adeliensis]MBK2097465.1 ABC transporter ATP-binding protein [Francisella adeliensis]QIW11928.1 ABC transporter ATP-binding protein [Francisella adeliensis]QIW13804.1 ABC transporter ATP-binding protein [Francisella adeliensis]
MLEVLKLFTAVLDTKQKKRFIVYVVLLFIGSISSIFGIGAVIPFISVLLQPEKITEYSLFQGYSYHQMVLFLAMILVLAFWLKNTIAAGLLLYQTKFLNGLTASIQSKLFKKYISMDYEYHLGRSTPALIRNINTETSQVSGGIINPLGALITDLFSTFFIVAVLLYLNVLFSSVIILSLGIFVLTFMSFIRKKSAEQGKVRSAVWASMTKSTLNGLSGIKEVKLYQREDYFTNNFDDKSQQLKKATIFSNFYQQIPKMFIEAIAISVVFIMLVVFIYSGVSAVDLFVLLSVFGVASAQLLPALNRIMSSLTNIKYSKQALVTIHKELCGDNDIVNNSSKLNEINEPIFNKQIKLENISYSYPDGTQALKDISINIQKGKKTALIGPSGSGKSTLVDLLLGFYIPQRGGIYIDSDKVDSVKTLQKLFAYIPQQIILYDCSIRENIAFAMNQKNIDDARIWKCLEMAKLKEFVKGLPKSIDSFVGENGIRLSGGQRQRLGIARALYQNPQILVMDEATSALDNETEKEVTNVIKELKNITIVTIAHRLSTIEGYDKVYSLDKGILK